MILSLILRKENGDRTAQGGERSGFKRRNCTDRLLVALYVTGTLLSDSAYNLDDKRDL